ncbi:SID1 transmembrane family member 1, partial [Dissostichus eleginoides]
GPARSPHVMRINGTACPWSFSYFALGYRGREALALALGKIFQRVILYSNSIDQEVSG